MIEPQCVYSVGLRVRFRGLSRREGVLLRGPAGWAEFSAFPEYDDAEARSWLDCAVEAAETGWPAPLRTRIPVNATVPAVSASEVAGVLATFPGCRTAKVKVAEPGQAPGADETRLAAVRDALGPGAHIRIDANGAWDVDTAVRRIRSCDTASGGLEYVEQPCRSVEELAAVRRRVDVPIAADESIRRSEDPLRVSRTQAADIAVLKVQPLGGVRACLRIAEQIRLPVVVSSALESSVGIAAGVALAACLPELPYACGLATVALLEQDVIGDPLVAEAGMIPVRSAVWDVADEAFYRADSERSAWWLARLQRVWGLAPGTGRMDP